MKMKNKKYLQWVASLPCIFCATLQGVQAHHLRVMVLGAGVGRKTPDIFPLPVCYKCHEDCHNGTHPKEDQMRWCLQTIGRAFAEEMIQWKK